MSRKEDWYEEEGTSSPMFVIQYHIKKDILDKKSKYQQIDIIENELFGKMLFLDGDLQIAEKDGHIYNKAMVAPLVESKSTLQEVAILGCGDGGVLYELLQHNPKHVYLVDIDEEVIKAAKEYLQPICHDAFDRDNVEVVIQDAKEFLQQDHSFDAVIYDLTNEPHEILEMDASTFLHEMFSNIAKCLKQGGVLSIQCCDKTNTKTLSLLQDILSQYFINPHFTTISVPSFCEEWVIASVQKK